MRLLSFALLLLATTPLVALAKKPARSRPAAVPPPRGPKRSSSSSRSSGRASAPRRREYEEDDIFDDEEEDLGFDDDFDDEEEDDEFFDDEEEILTPPPRSRKSSVERSSRPPPKSSQKSRSSRAPPSVPASRKRPERERYVEDDYEDDSYPSRRSPKRPAPRRGDGPPPSKYGRNGGGGRRPSAGGRSGSVVPYTPAAPAAFTRGLSAIRNAIPDASAVREAAYSSINAARETSSTLSANLYREVKGLTSSELEQVMLKASRPDDTPVKGKHVERLVGVTYQISSRYDIYDAVLRKLWGKMSEKDWRTTIKALYILHRFSSDGSPEHAPALKARLRELRRTRDPKRKDKYFNSKQLLAGDTKPENIKFRAFMSRYAHYVLLRAQCFGGMFDEISEKPAVGKKEKQKPPKPITSTSLRTEHLEAAAMLLKAGVACQLKDGEECENTAIAVERVASDLIGLTTAVAIALNRALKNDDLQGADPALIKKWCEFYSEELLPQSRAMVKKTSAKLDAYGLFLPSRMGASVSPEILQKGLRAEDQAEESVEEESDATAQSAEEQTKSATSDQLDEEEEDEEELEAEEADEIEKEADLYDEYEYEEEEYYDDEFVE